MNKPLFRRNEIEVVTSQYRFSHGKEPKGRGLWLFCFVGSKDVFEFNGSYGEAKRAAIAEAQKRNVCVAYVMS